MAKWIEYLLKKKPADEDMLMLEDAESHNNKRVSFSGIADWLIEKMKKNNLISGALRFKGSSSYAALPGKGAAENDYYYCSDGDGTHGPGYYAWNGSSWIWIGNNDKGIDKSLKVEGAAAEAAATGEAIASLKEDIGNTGIDYVNYNITKDFFVNVDDVIVSSGGFGYSNLIAVNNGDEVHIIAAGASNFVQMIGAYNAELKRINFMKSNGAELQDYFLKIDDENIKFVRVSYDLSKPCRFFILNSYNNKNLLKQIDEIQDQVDSQNDKIQNQINDIHNSFGKQPSIFALKNCDKNVLNTMNDFLETIEYIGAEGEYKDPKITMMFLVSNEKYKSLFVNVMFYDQDAISTIQLNADITEKSLYTIEKDNIKMILNGTAILAFEAPEQRYMIQQQSYGNSGYGVHFRNDDKYISGNAIKNQTLSEEKLSNELLEKINASKTLLTGKNIVTICDSLGTSGIWQEKLAELTGCIFSKDLNAICSAGGTKTLSESNQCGQYRAKRLVEQKDIIPDIILIENVNDSDNANWGECTDEPYFNISREKLEINPLASKEHAEQFFVNNFSDIMNNNAPVVGGAIGIPYTVSNAILLRITGTPTSSGDVGITLANEGLYRYISVSTENSIENIVDKIVEYNWTAYDAVKIGTDSVLFIPISTGYTPSIRIINDCGITSIAMENQSGNAYYYRYFVSHNIQDWKSANKWIEKPSLDSIYKGLIEYLQYNFPKAIIYWFIPATWNVNVNDESLYRADGSIDYDKVLSTKTYGIEIFEKQVEVCNYYKIPTLDIRQEACLTPENLTTFMNSGNVHPKDAAYERWGETLARMLT